MMVINNCSTTTKYEMCFSLEVRKTVVLQKCEGKRINNNVFSSVQSCQKHFVNA